MAQPTDTPRRVTKVCTTCGVERPLPEFYLNHRTGRPRAQCRVCARARSRRYYAEHREQIRAARAERLAPPEPRPTRPTPVAAPAPPRDERPPQYTRVCTKCGRERPIAEFYLVDRRTGRRGRQCKPCLRARSRQYYKENRERIRAQQRTCYHREDPDQRRRRQMRYRAKYRQRYAVRRRTHRLRVQGVLVLADHCADCGAPAVHLHHEEYGDVVALVSLCRQCHMARHWREWRRTGTGRARYFWEYDEEE